MRKWISLLLVIVFGQAYCTPLSYAAELNYTPLEPTLYKDFHDYQKPYAKRIKKRSGSQQLVNSSAARNLKTISPGSLALLEMTQPKPSPSTKSAGVVSRHASSLQDDTQNLLSMDYATVMAYSRTLRNQIIWDTLATARISRPLDSRPQSVGGQTLPDTLGGPPDDSLYGQQWEMQALGMQSAWDISMGNGITVAVIDSGIQLNHPDLMNNIWINSDEIPGDGIDNDHNGYIDDINGWSFYLNSGNFSPGDSHGTQVAGLIAAQQNNNQGISGIAPESKIMVLRDDGYPNEGYYDGIKIIPRTIQAIYYAIDNGARVINMSFGMPLNALNSATYLAFQDALLYGISKGVIFVAASGNVGMTDSTYLIDEMPMIFFECLATGGVSNPGTTRVSSSNYGPQLDFVAPGSGLTSTTIGSTYASGLSGTSYATAIVSGVVALMLSNDPTLSYEDICRRLKYSASDRGATGYDQQYGFGLVNPYRAMTEDYYYNGQLKKKWFSDGKIETYYFSSGNIHERYNPTTNQTTEYNTDGSIKATRQGSVFVSITDPSIPIPPHAAGKFNEYNGTTYTGYTEYYQSGYIRTHYDVATGQLDIYYDNKYYLERGFTTPPRKSMTFFNNGNQIQYTEYWDNGNVKYYRTYNHNPVYDSLSYGGERNYYEDGTVERERESLLGKDIVMEYSSSHYLTKIFWDSSPNWGENDIYEIIYDSNKNILSKSMPWGNKYEYDSNQKLTRFTNGYTRDIYEYYSDGVTLKKITTIDGFIENFNTQGVLTSRTENPGWVSTYYASGNLKQRSNASLNIVITYLDENINNTHVGKRNTFSFQSTTEDPDYLYHLVTYTYYPDASIKRVTHKLTSQISGLPTKTSTLALLPTGQAYTYTTFDQAVISYYDSGRMQSVLYAGAFKCEFLDEDFYLDQFPGFWHGRLKSIRDYHQTTGGYSLITAYYPGTDIIKTEELRDVNTGDLINTTEYYENGIYPKTITVPASSGRFLGSEGPGVYTYYFSCNLKSYLNTEDNILYEYFDENTDLNDGDSRLGKGRLSIETNRSTNVKIIHVYEGQSIQAAIGKAQAGDTIFIHAGTYHESITVKNGVNLKGEDKNTTTITGDFAPLNNVITALGNNIIEGLKITGGGPYQGYPSTALNIQGSGTLIRDNIFIDNQDYAILLMNSTSATIQQNLFINNHLAIQLPTDSCLIQYNTFDRNSIAINILFGSAPTIQYNIITNSSFQSIYEYAYNRDPHQGYAIVQYNTLFNNAERGGYNSINLPPAIQNWTSGNINTDPLYTDPTHGDYSLRPGSPALGRGYTQMYVQRSAALNSTPAVSTEIDSFIAMRTQQINERSTASSYPIKNNRTKIDGVIFD